MLTLGFLFEIKIIYRVSRPQRTGGGSGVPAGLPARGHAGVRRAAGAVRRAPRARRQEHAGVPRHEARAELLERRQGAFAVCSLTLAKCSY